MTIIASNNLYEEITLIRIINLYALQMSEIQLRLIIHRRDVKAYLQISLGRNCQNPFPLMISHCQSVSFPRNYISTEHRLTQSKICPARTEECLQFLQWCEIVNDGIRMILR